MFASPFVVPSRATRALALAATASLLVLSGLSCGGSEGGGTTTPSEPTPVSGVVQPATATVEVGSDTQFSVLVRYSDGSTRTFTSSSGGTWTSSDPSIATITSSGLATGVAPGTVTITARAEGQSDTATLTVTPPPVASVSVTPESAEVQVGSTVALTATTLDAGGAVLTGRTVTWSSSDAEIAIVGSDGTVTALSLGIATITARSEGQSGESTIAVVPIPVASVDVTPATATVELGQTQQFTATPVDSNGTPLADRSVSWTSGDTGILIVDGNGLATAVGVGTATVTATSEGVEGAATLTVVPRPVASIEVTPAASEIVAGASVQLDATVRDAEGGLLEGRTVAWTSSDPSVATVTSAGLVTGVAVGSATITASSEGVDGTATIAVADPRADLYFNPGFEVTPTAIQEGESFSWPTKSVVNGGNGDAVMAGPFVCLFRSADAVYDAADTRELCYDPTTVAAGDSVQAVGDSRPFVGDPGEYFFFLVADPDGEVDESDETNNVTEAAPLTVTAAPGAIEVSVESVSGSDPDGYTLRLDGEDRGAIAEGETVRLADLAAGNYTVRLEGIAGSCAIIDSSQAAAPASSFEREAAVTAGVTTDVTFRVSCTSALTSGVAMDGIALANADARYFSIEVPAGAAQLQVVTAGSNGDADLLVRNAGLPWRASEGRDCVSQSDDSNEDCTIASPAEGTWFILVYAFEPFTDLTVTATVVASEVASVEVSPADREIVVSATQQLTATLRDASDNVLTGRIVTWNSSREDVATVDANGLVTGLTYGSTSITATSGEVSQSVGLHVYEAATSGFDITVEFLNPVSEADRQTFLDAAARWEQIITADEAGEPNASIFTCNGHRAEGVIDDVHIFAQVSSIDGEGGILGSAGFCNYGDDRVFLGVMTFDEADIDALRTGGGLDDVIIHEMGHVLGIGTLWNPLGLRSGVCEPTGDPIFTGAATLTAFNSVGGSGYTGGDKVPIENTGGSGTVCSHWRESVFDTELMTGFLDGGVTNPLSLVTVQSLSDIGYTVNPAAAEGYTLPDGLRLRASEGREISLGNDIVYPIAGIVQSDGSIRIVGGGEGGPRRR